MKYISLILICMFCFYKSHANKYDSLKIEAMVKHAQKINETYPDSAIRIYSQIIGITTNTPYHINVSRAYINLSKLLFSQNKDVKGSFDNLYNALKISEAINDSFGIAQINDNIGIRLSEQLRYSEAIAYFHHAYSVSKANKLGDIEISSMMNLADCYANLEKRDSALILLKNLESNIPNNVSNEYLQLLYSNIGNIYYNLGDVSNNLNYFKQALIYANRAIDFNLKINCI